MKGENMAGRMTTIELTETERQTIVNALYTAAAKYREIAANPETGRSGMVQQFYRQADEAKNAAERFEQADTIMVRE